MEWPAGPKNVRSALTGVGHCPVVLDVDWGLRLKGAASDAAGQGREREARGELAASRSNSLEGTAMNLGEFFFMLLSFTGAAIAVVAAIAMALGYVKRLPARSAPGQLSAEEVDAIRARLAELEQRDLRVEEIEERLDFVERALGRSREAKPLRNPSEK